MSEVNGSILDEDVVESNKQHPLPRRLPFSTDGEAKPSTSDNELTLDNKTSVRKGRTLVHRQRARHACLDCRARKVRCDVMATGTPCTNCRLDDQECIVARRKNRRNQPVLRDCTDSTSSDQIMLQPLGLSHAELDTPVMAPAQSADWDMDDCPDTTDLERLFTTLRDDELSSLEESLFKESFKYDETTLPQAEFVNPSSLSTPSIITGAPERGITEPNTQCDKSTSTAKRGLVLYIFYSFIAVDVLNLSSSERASSLEDEGCFHLPPRTAMDEFVKQYFLYVHPFMPLIDEGDFWSGYHARENTSSAARGDYSLFVIQAMLFMSCPFVSETTLSSLGLPSARRARATFYSRAKALFDSNCCQDPVSKAQGALMLTYHSDHPGELINTYWLDTAIHFARKAGADQPRDSTEFTSRIGQIRKRLWWCCILRDSIMSLGLRRHLSITHSTEIDYVQYALTEDDFRYEIWNSQVCKPDEKQVLVRQFVTLCKLGIILKDVLEFLYSPAETDLLEERPRLEEDCKSARAMMMKLDRWCDAARAKVQVNISQYEDHQDSIKLLSNAIYIYYHSARTSLLNHMILVSIESCGFGDDESRVTQHWVQTELNRSFRCVTRSLTELEQRSLAQYLPNTFIALSAFSFVWYTLGAEVTKPVGDSGNEIMTGLRTIVCLMTVFRNLYENTDHFLQCIGKLVGFARSAKIVDTLFPRPTSSRQISKPHSSHIELAARPSLRSQARDGRHFLDGVIVDSHRCYLWLTLSIDYSLCHGNLPNVVDYPNCLQQNAKAILAA